MNRFIDYQITGDDAGNTILSFLQARHYSHGIIADLKKYEDGILVNDAHVNVRHILQAGENLSIHIYENPCKEPIVICNSPLSIVFEDEDILVVNKPANMPIHPSQKHYEDTLANLVVAYYQTQQSPFIFRCINRLDRDTTGLTIIAKNPLSAASLSDQMLKRQIKREYLAIVSGAPSPTNGTIDAPIARCEGSVITREVNFEGGEKAITHYKTIAGCKYNYSLISLSLDTGRTHQIRVHMKYLGYPLIGDSLYETDLSHIKRQALHSAKLTFLHPITGKPLFFSAPLPADMEALL